MLAEVWLKSVAMYHVAARRRPSWYGEFTEPDLYQITCEQTGGNNRSSAITVYINRSRGASTVDHSQALLSDVGRC